MDPGESAAEACAREVLEETGLQVLVTKLVGIYTTPHLLIEYPDGNKFQPVTFSFEAQVTGGELKLSEETTDFGYFTVAELETMDLMGNHLHRIYDAIKNQLEAVFQ